jgi:formate hydrogenlyase transcriptional activator
MGNESKPANPHPAPGPRRAVSARRAAWRVPDRMAELQEQVRCLSLERDRQALVLRINKLLLEHMDPEPMALAISSALWEHTRHDFITLTALDEDGGMEQMQFLDMPTLRGQYRIGSQVPELVPVASKGLGARQIDVLGPERIAAMKPPELVRLMHKERIASICLVPLYARDKALGVLGLGSRQEGHFTDDLLILLEQVAAQVALALQNTLVFQGVRSSRDKLAEEKLYLEEEVRGDFATHEIVGSSPSLQRVMEQIDTVAPSDATVLLLGETGTGKELLARAIHERSRRQARTFVRLNCSAIPLGLVESELFGHERGAFTGAIAKKVGRFELANQGTLFLDEIGDLPLDLQPKLLRAIQEREFERLGSTRTIRVDARLIAATHQDLAKMVEQGTFRRDLFYRLNVFPIRVPALRERKEDIPGLVRYFTQKFARAMDKRIERIPAETMAALVAWPWPGNIRELHNLVERSVILSSGSELRVPLSEMRLEAPEPAAPAPPAGPPAGGAMTLEDHERQGILDALEACGGVVGGPGGAAERLGLKRSTLNSKMRKLGIHRPRA